MMNLSNRPSNTAGVQVPLIYGTRYKTSELELRDIEEISEHVQQAVGSYPTSYFLMVQGGLAYRIKELVW